MKALPKQVTFIGAGYIGMEFAHMMARYGAKVTIIHSDSKPLSIFDQDMVAKIVEASKDLGITFIFDAKVQKG